MYEVALSVENAEATTNLLENQVIFVPFMHAFSYECTLKPATALLL
jgi:hypothetical protein